MARWLAFASLLIGLAASVGCSRPGDTAKNSELDRPKPADAAKNK